MAKSAEEAFRKIQDKLAQTMRDLPAIIGNEAVNFTIENFDRQGWLGDIVEPWQKRKNPTKWGKKDDEGRAILIKNTRLKRSIRVSKILEDRVTITAGGEDVPYARAHNYGFRGVVNQQVDEHYRKNKLGQNIKVSAHSRTINQNLPKRQFIGSEADSQYLKARIKRIVMAEIRKIFK